LKTPNSAEAEPEEPEEPMRAFRPIRLLSRLPTSVLASFVALIALLAFSTTPWAQSSPPPVYLIVVHPNSPATTLERQFLEDTFLKKVKTWPNREAIRPVDQVLNATVRRRFTDEVLRRSVEAVRAYWQQRIFSGRDVPPPELENDEAVIKYVTKYPGAIGYVSGTARLNGLKVVTVY
jgi:hypothetical protein